MKNGKFALVGKCPIFVSNTRSPVIPQKGLCRFVLPLSPSLSHIVMQLSCEQELVRFTFASSVSPCPPLCLIASCHLDVCLLDVFLSHNPIFSSTPAPPRHPTTIVIISLVNTSTPVHRMDSEKFS